MVDKEKNKNTRTLIPGMVSVIVPVYNGEKYLRTCIESIIDQDYKNIEAILVNDGSTDSSGEICDKYALIENRIRVVHKKNGGPADARNAGIENSKGEFIFFVDADDSIKNNALNLLIENYRQTKADMVIGDFELINDNTAGSRYKGVPLNDRVFTKRDIADYARNYLKTPNKFSLFKYSWGRLYKSSIIRDNDILFDPDLYNYEDATFNYAYLKYANRVYFFKKAIYNFIIHNDYMSASWKAIYNPDKFSGHIQSLNNIGVFIKEHIPEAETEKEVGRAYINIIIIHFVRICRQVNDHNRIKIYKLVSDIINGPMIRNNLRFYSPSKGESRIVPLLMKMRLAWPIIWICMYKASKRYGTGAVAR